MKNNIQTKFAFMFFLVLTIFLGMLNLSSAASLDFRTNESIVESFYQVREETTDMLDAGLPVSHALAIINEGEIILRSERYDKLIDIVREANSVNVNVRILNIDVSDTGSKISELEKRGYNLSKEENNWSNAKENFSVGNFEDSKIEIGKLKSKLDNLIIKEAKNLEEILRRFDETARSNRVDTDLLEDLLINIKSARKKRNYVYIIQVVNDISDINESILSLSRINSAIDHLESNNKKVKRLIDLRNEAYFALSDSEFETVILINNEIENLLDIIFITEQGMTQVQSKLLELGYLEGIAKINETLNLAIAYFDNENYEDADKLVSDSFDQLNILEAKALLFGAVNVDQMQIQILETLAEDPWIMLVIILIIVVVVFVIIIVRRFTLLFLHKRKIISLEKEKLVINSLIKQNQLDYFVKHLLDRETYDSTVINYQERQIKINETIPVLKNKIQKLRIKIKSADKNKKIKNER